MKMLPETQFFVRAFPSLNKDWDNVKLDVNKKLIHLRSIEDLKRGTQGSNIYWQFKTDGVLVNVSQEEFYKAIVTEDLLHKALQGIDLVILCFGSSGTGKTYSALGLYNRYEYRGIAPRLLEDLFRLKEENKSLIKMDIFLTYVEIIGKNVHNLLHKDKPVMFKSGSRTYNVTLGIHLENVCSGLKVLFAADDRRDYENENSHCGTSIITFEIACVSLIKSNPVNTAAKIHIIDTAGTDYGNKPTKSKRCHVNANLAKCYLNTLCSWECPGQNSKTFSHRGSVMALYLGSSMNNGCTRYVGHIRTSNEDIQFSMSTLLFGTRLRKLQSPLLVRAKARNLELIIKGLQNQITEMKENIIMEKLIKGTFMPSTLSQDQMDYVMREIRNFLTAEINERCLLTKAHPSILLIGIRELYNRDLKEGQDFYNQLLAEKDAALQLAEEKLEAGRPSISTSTSGSRSRKKKTSSKTITPIPSATPNEEQMQEEMKPIYAFSKLELENELTGEENYGKTFNEFLATSPHLKSIIKLYETDIEESFKEKCDLQSKLTELKYEINLLRLELQKEEWNTFNKSLENKMCTHEGRILEKSSEQESLEKDIETKVEEFKLYRSSLLDAHNKYMAANITLNEVRVNAEKQFNEHTKNMYSNMLLLPPEPVTVDKEMQTSTITEQPPDEKVVSKKCFYKMQRKPDKRKKQV